MAKQTEDMPALQEASISTDIYQRLKKEILRLDIPAGSILQEVELASKYGCSRTPAREAVRRLVQEGLAVRHGRMYQVRQFTPPEVRDLYEVREGLEKMSIRLAIERANDAELASLVPHLERQLQAMAQRDKWSFNLLDTEFHLAIATLARNTLLQQELALIHDRVMLVRELELSREQGMRNAIEDHRRIVDALIRRNIDAAEAEMRYHVRSVIALYHGYREPRPDGAASAAPALPAAGA